MSTIRKEAIKQLKNFLKGKAEVWSSSTDNNLIYVDFSNGTIDEKTRKSYELKFNNELKKHSLVVEVRINLF